MVWRALPALRRVMRTQAVDPPAPPSRTMVHSASDDVASFVCQALYNGLQMSGNPAYKLEDIDFGRRLAVDREMG